MVIAFPGRERAGVGAPHALQRHGRGATTGGGAVEIAHEIIVPEDFRLRHEDFGLFPELGPPLGVRLELGVVGGLEGGFDPGLGDRLGAGALGAGGHGQREQGGVVHPLPGRADGIGKTIGAFLLEPAQAFGFTFARWAVAELLHRIGREQAHLAGGGAGDVQEGDRLGYGAGMDERAKFGAGLEPGDPFGGGEVEFEGFDGLGRVEHEFDAAGGQFGGRIVVIVVGIEDLIELGHVGFGDHSLHGGPGEAVFDGEMFGGWSFVPEIAPIQRTTHGVAFAPEQEAHRAVPERDSLVPGADRGGELEIERRVGKSGRLPRRNDHRGRTKQNSWDGGLHFYWRGCLAGVICWGACELK